MKYSLFTLAIPECTPAEAAKIIKEAGYDGVEWRCTELPDVLPPIPNCWTSNRATLNTKKWKSVVTEFRKITQDNGLEFSSLASYCRAGDVENIKINIEIAKALGCPRLRVCGPGYDGKTNYWDVLKKGRDDYARAAELCREAGVQGVVELHAGGIACSASLAHRLLDGVDPRHMGAMYDPGNMVLEGYENWQLGCELLGPYLAYCHAKNSRLHPVSVAESGAFRWGHESCEMHTGFVDWIAVFKAFRSVKYDGWISNEDHYLHQGSAPERIRNGLQHLKKCHEIAGKAAS